MFKQENKYVTKFVINYSINYIMTATFCDSFTKDVPNFITKFHP